MNRPDADATPDSWQRLQELFARARALDGAARATLVEQECGGDAPLRARLVSMLELDIQSRGPLDEPAVDWPHDAASEAGAALVGQRIGRYELVRVVAFGGMGTVFEARQEQPRRTVAVKLLRGGLVSPASLRRFELEAEALGRLQHPGIAQILESGTFTRDGALQPFFAMEFVAGLPLNEFAESRRPGTRARVELWIRLCEAVEHAHQRGVIHRDLKPANILVAEDGLPKILDFGIARIIDREARTTTLRTDVHQLLGTLPYMSPEQASGDPDAIDTRSDVYALGVLGYELLCGRLPHDLGGKSLPESIRIIREQEPTPIGSVTPVFRGDLGTILTKALAKEKERRYGSAAELAGDLRRWLANEPIAARPPSRVYQLRKFVRRNRILVGGLAAVFVSLVAGIGVAIGMVREVARQQRLVVASEARTRASLDDALAEAASINALSDGELAEIPGGEGARLELDEILVKFQERIAARGGESVAPAYELGYAYQRRGECYARIGRSADAVADFRRSLEIRERAAATASDVNARRALGVGHWKLSEGLALVGELAEATEHDRTALQVLESLAEEHAFSPADGALYVAAGHRRLAERLADRGDSAAAAAEYWRALREAEAGLAMAPDHPSLAPCKRLALLGLARVELDRGRPEPAIDLASRAIECTNSVAARQKQVRVSDRLFEARAHEMLAEAELARGRGTDALAAARRAFDLAAALSDADPNDLESRQLRAEARISEAAAHLALRDFEPALAQLSAATDEFEELARKDRDRASIARDLGVSSLWFARTIEAQPGVDRDPSLVWRQRAKERLEALDRAGQLLPRDRPWLEEARRAPDVAGGASDAPVHDP